MVEPQAVGKGRIEIVGLAGYFHLFCGLHAVECAHVVQAVGELYQQSAYVVVYGVEQLAEVVDLLRLPVLAFLSFGNHIHQEGDIVAELVLYIVDGHGSVLHHIVEQCRRHHVRAQLQVAAHNCRHSYWMQYVGLA